MEKLIDKVSALELLKNHWGHDKFRTSQDEIIKHITIEQKHALVLMPTGGGKSVCYQIPALMFEGKAIVISPLIALMQDQVDALVKKKISASFINSSLSSDERKNRLDNFVNGKTKILYVTPERFRKVEFVEALSKIKISLLAIDEAHCISEWGHDFRPDYSRIAEFREILGNPITIALTATASPKVQLDIIKKLGLAKDEIKIFHRGIDRPNLRLEAVDVFDEKETLNAILDILNNYKGSGIIYFSLIKKLEEYSEILSDKGYKHSIYHGKLNPIQRKKILRKFINGEESLVLATNAFGMGIDKADIRFVIHAEIPSSIESYYQEIGRAGRDGGDSLCTMLYNNEDLLTQMEFIKWANPNADYYSRVYDVLHSKIEEVNSMGIDFLREELSHKNKNDFRIETVLGMLDLYGVTEGSIEKQNLILVDELPFELTDNTHLQEKLKNDNLKLLSVVNYFRTKHCRRVFISDYFGFPNEPTCGNCDVCN